MRLQLNADDNIIYDSGKDIDKLIISRQNSSQKLIKWYTENRMMGKVIRITQLTLTYSESKRLEKCPKLTIETLEKGVKYVQS